MRKLLLVAAITIPLSLLSATAQVRHADPNLQTLMDSAKKGDAAAETELGRAYEDGNGVAQDDAEAAGWFRKAAEQGNPQAQNSLGVMYALGRGVARDKEEAVRWYRKAAKGGLPEGFYNVAISYFNGEGVNQDLSLAYAYMEIAQSKGDAQAAEALHHISDELQGHLEMSRLRLAGLYEKGEDVPQDYSAAAKIYRELADSGPRQSRFYGTAQFNLCQLYATGRGVQQDFTEARSRCKEAAKHEIAFAYVVLGRMAEKGTGEPVDLRAAAEYYQHAASERVADGFMELGRLKLASGSQNDNKEAYFWFYLAQAYNIAGADSLLQKAAAQLSSKEISSVEAAANEWRRKPVWDKVKKVKIR